MRFSVAGVGGAMAAGIETALRSAGHEPGEPADLVVLGVEPPVGTVLMDVTASDWLEAVQGLRDAFGRVRDAAQRLSGSGGGVVIVLVPAHAVRTSAGCGLAAIAGSFMTTVAQVAAVELAPRGVRVNVVSVGPLDGVAPDRVVDAVPLGRLITAGDVGGACALLAGDDATAIAGAVVAVDGGYAVTKAVGGSPFATRG